MGLEIIGAESLDMRSLSRKALNRAQEAISSGQYDLVVMDEVCIAIHFALIKIENVLSLLEQKPKSVELILTGRYCPPELIEKADLVTEMREVKHYYQEGVQARKGIEA